MKLFNKLFKKRPEQRYLMIIARTYNGDEHKTFPVNAMTTMPNSYFTYDNMLKEVRTVWDKEFSLENGWKLYDIQLFERICKYQDQPTSVLNK